MQADPKRITDLLFKEPTDQALKPTSSVHFSTYDLRHAVFLSETELDS